MKRKKLLDLILCALFTALIAAGAFVKIPGPVVDFTLQTFFVSLCGLVLGWKNGGISVAVYMLLGLIGIPVFTQGGGLGYLLKPSFGYIIGFVFGAMLTGYIARKGKTADKTHKLTRLIAASLCGLLAVYLIGTVYCGLILKFYLGAYKGLLPLLTGCVFVFLPTDIAEAVIAAIAAKRLIKAKALN